MHQSNLTISIQGYLGSFHHEVAAQFFGEKIGLVLERDTFAEVFSDVASKTAAFGVAAIHNSLAGPIAETQQLLESMPQLIVIEEITYPIHQNLIVVPGAQLEELRAVHSHPIALMQCQNFLANHPALLPIESADTALSVAEMMQAKIRERAAIGSRQAAQLHQAEILLPNIEDSPDNQTTFIIFTRTVD